MNEQLGQPCHAAILSGINAVTVNKATLSLARINAPRWRVWVIIRLPKPWIKPHIANHRTCDQIVQALSQFFCTVCDKKLGRSLGTRLVCVYICYGRSKESIRLLFKSSIIWVVWYGNYRMAMTAPAIALITDSITIRHLGQERDWVLHLPVLAVS